LALAPALYHKKRKNGEQMFEHLFAVLNFPMLALQMQRDYRSGRQLDFKQAIVSDRHVAVRGRFHTFRVSEGIVRGDGIASQQDAFDGTGMPTRQRAAYRLRVTRV